MNIVVLEQVSRRLEAPPLPVTQHKALIIGAVGTQFKEPKRQIERRDCNRPARTTTHASQSHVTRSVNFACVHFAHKVHFVHLARARLPREPVRARLPRESFGEYPEFQLPNLAGEVFPGNDEGHVNGFDHPHQRGPTAFFARGRTTLRTSYKRTSPLTSESTAYISPKTHPRIASTSRFGGRCR